MPHPDTIRRQPFVTESNMGKSFPSYHSTREDEKRSILVKDYRTHRQKQTDMMRTKSYLLILMFLFSVQSFSQSADERIAALIGQADWFGLEKDYPSLKDSVKTVFLKEISETMIAYYFNRRDDALEHIHELLANHKTEIGVETALRMEILSCQIEKLRGNYGLTVQKAQNIISQLKEQHPHKGTYESLRSAVSFFGKLSNTPAPSISRPNCEISVPIEIEKITLPANIEPKGWRGTLIFIPVTINGKTYRFIFDTGAGTTYMSARFAKEVGVRILNDSLQISATNSAKKNAILGQVGTLDSMQIGNITFHYPMIAIAPPNTLDNFTKIDAVLGMDFINLLDEIRIYPKEGKMVFPVSATPLPDSGRNLMIDERMLIIKAKINDETVKLFFDTGHTTAGLYSQYYKEHKSQLKSLGKRQKMISGGVNTYIKKNILRLPAFTIEIGEVPIELRDLTVDIGKNALQTTNNMGVMGMSMVNQFNCVTINLRDMFLKLE